MWIVLFVSWFRRLTQIEVAAIFVTLLFDIYIINKRDLNMHNLLRSAPLLLFIILLLALSISVYFGNAVASWKNGFISDIFGNKEGYISFNKDGQLVTGTQVAIPKYADRNVYKLYDNMYFDRLNGNLLEIVPGTGTELIHKIQVYLRSGKTGGIYDVSNGVPVIEASLNQMDNSNNAFIVESKISPNEKPTILYASFGRNTYIHAMDLSANTSVISAYFPDFLTSPPIIKNFDWGAGNALPVATSRSYKFDMSAAEPATISDASDGLYMNVQYYDASRTVMQICKDTYFDSSLNGKLLMKTNDGSLNVYDRPAPGINTSAPATFSASSSIPKQQTGMDDNGFAPMIILHPNNKCLIYYVAHYFNTTIVVLAKKSDGSLYIHSKRFFISSGIFEKGEGAPAPPSDPNKGADTPAYDPNILKDTDKDTGTNDVKNPLSDYYNWLAFWNTVASSSDIANAMRSSEYIPKTAIVPPICPTCTQCAGGNCSGVCNGCGGSGGSGTSTGTKNKFSDYLARFGNASTGSSLGVGTGGVSGNVYDNPDSQRAYQLAKDAGSGTTGLLRDAVGGTVGLAKETVGGTVGLAKETVGGAIGLVKDAGSGVASVLKTDPTKVTGPTMGGQSGQIAGGGGIDQPIGIGTRKGDSQSAIDPYSYNGALVSKGGNYIPITSDFSAFAK